MSAIDVAVVITAAAAIGWVNWYFFLSHREATAAVAGAGGVQEIAITVHGGYEPSTVKAKSGQTLRLTFDRQETSSCSEEIVFPDFGIRRFLPAHEKTTIEITPPEPGVYEFMCGMSMLHGRVVVE